MSNCIFKSVKIQTTIAQSLVNVEYMYALFLKSEQKEFSEYVFFLNIFNLKRV